MTTAGAGVVAFDGTTNVAGSVSEPSGVVAMYVMALVVAPVDSLAETASESNAATSASRRIRPS